MLTHLRAPVSHYNSEVMPEVAIQCLNVEGQLDRGDLEYPGLSLCLRRGVDLPSSSFVGGRLSPTSLTLQGQDLAK